MKTPKREVLVRAEDITDPSYGCEPAARPISEHLRLGFLNLDKPVGPTSHEVVTWVKRILEVRKTGHAGTLDPKVSGVLPVALEDSTRALQALSRADKEYVCLVHLHSSVPQHKLEKVLSEFTGEIYQRPPLRSAVKRQVRIRRIHHLKLLERDGKEVLLGVRCEAGTYIRKLVFDMGEALGCGAHMLELRRTASGPFREDETLVRLQDVADAYAFWKEEGREDLLRKVVLPVEACVRDLPKIVIRDGAIDAICHGASLAAPGVLSVESGASVGDLVAVMSLKGELVALMEATMTSKQIAEADRGLVAKPVRVVMKPGTYPRKWK
ncbi:MAG: RNA-guided pseudouridylation complex pseudouridine synthase subunit Cbf5 [Candidatus Hadarchaeales archaeon]